MQQKPHEQFHGPACPRSLTHNGIPIGVAVAVPGSISPLSFMPLITSTYSFKFTCWFFVMLATGVAGKPCFKKSCNLSTVCASCYTPPQVTYYLCANTPIIDPRKVAPAFTDGPGS